jgi:hypothetical protein
MMTKYVITVNSARGRRTVIAAVPWRGKDYALSLVLAGRIVVRVSYISETCWR